LEESMPKIALTEVLVIGKSALKMIAVRASLL
jgi:hypothetical protein